MRSVPIDYTRYLRSAIVESTLRPTERAGLTVGEIVTVPGEDGIPARKAKVLSIVGGKVRLQFLEPFRLTA